MAGIQLPPGFMAGLAQLNSGTADQIIAMLGATADLGPNRPLNSWMAFRSFYEAMLKQIPQKGKSKLLTVFWHEDLFEAKWVILAKAYSIVRGRREKKDAPLGRFFDLCAPLIGVIPAEEYLAYMGWEIVTPDDGTAPWVKRIFIPRLEDLPDKFTTTTLGVTDLVTHCYAANYVDDIEYLVSATRQTSLDSLSMVSKPLPAGLLVLQKNDDAETLLGDEEDSLYHLFNPDIEQPPSFNPNAGDPFEPFDPLLDTFPDENHRFLPYNFF